MVIRCAGKWRQICFFVQCRMSKALQRSANAFKKSPAGVLKTLGMLFVAATYVVHNYTLAHPFLLADNRYAATQNCFCLWSKFSTCLLRHATFYMLSMRASTFWLSCVPSVKRLGFKVAWSWWCVRHMNMPVCMTQQFDCAGRLLQALYILPLEGYYSCITPCKILPGASVSVLRLQHCERSQGWWSVKYMDTGLLCMHCHHFDTSLASGIEVNSDTTLLQYI